MTTEAHCASRLHWLLSPVFTAPRCIQFSTPITSNNPSPISSYQIATIGISIDNVVDAIEIEINQTNRKRQIIREISKSFEQLQKIA